MNSIPRRRVLVCDDHSLLRSILVNAIREVLPNAEIQEAANGERAEELVRKNKYDLIFMDVEMPKQNGLDTISKIRDEKLAEDTPIVVCTGCKGETALVRGWQLKVDHYITKPFDLEEIERVIDEIKWRGFSAV
ncbi:MAG: response regulator [Candidatus Eremiobacteraeota bacterium]|nr:response regulator [Candidatus Eremiobacteraeota bacterium]